MSIVVCADAVGLGDPTLGETLGGAGSESRRRLLGQGLLVKERLPGWSWMRYAYAETTPSLNLAASLAAQIRGGWAEVGTTIAEHPAEHTHTQGHDEPCAGQGNEQHRSHWGP